MRLYFGGGSNNVRNYRSSSRLTLPSLISNYRKQTYVAGLEKCVSVLENGFKKILADDGVDKLTIQAYGTPFLQIGGMVLKTQNFCLI